MGLSAADSSSPVYIDGSSGAQPPILARTLYGPQTRSFPCPFLRQFHANK